MKISPLISRRIVFVALNILIFVESVSGAQGESRKLNMCNLNLNADVRALGMADAAVAQKDGVAGINYNPALIGFLRNAEAALMYNGFENIINYGFLGYAVAVDSTWSLGFFALYFNWPDSSLAWSTPMPGKDLSTRIFDLDLGFSAAYRLNQFLTLGLSLKNIIRKIPAPGELAHVLALTAGFICDKNKLSMGASVRNLGTTISPQKTEADLPLTFAFGAAYMLHRNIAIAGEIEAQRPGGEIQLTNKAGIEFRLVKALRLRSGVNIKKTADMAEPALSAAFGAGLQFRRLSFDYAYSPKREFGESHFFALQYTFPKLATKTEPKTSLVQPAENVLIRVQNHQANDEAGQTGKANGDYFLNRGLGINSAQLNHLIELVQLAALKSDSLNRVKTVLQKTLIQKELAALEQSLTSEASKWDFKVIKLTVKNESSLYELLSRIDDFNQGDIWKRIYTAWMGQLVEPEDLHPAQSVFILYKIPQHNYNPAGAP